MSAAREAENAERLTLILHILQVGYLAMRYLRKSLKVGKMPSGVP